MPAVVTTPPPLDVAHPDPTWLSDRAAAYGIEILGAQGSWRAETGPQHATIRQLAGRV